MDTTRKKSVTLDQDCVTFSSESLLGHVRIHVNYHVYSQKIAICALNLLKLCIDVSALSHIRIYVTYHIYAQKTAVCALYVLNLRIDVSL